MHQIYRCNNLIEPMAKSKSGEKTFEYFYSRLRSMLVFSTNLNYSNILVVINNSVQFFLLYNFIVNQSHEAWALALAFQHEKEFLESLFYDKIKMIDDLNFFSND
ncbi:hypothetical protein BpHYR1_040915 [Brachionus plicatilis]|uniref:Uncharacterized protein n=1 Tax=Brachionus plicatilis TaxID=10195 RepID=A0A3M7PSQ9_BRAPC|nr:hypothetical protein BpHYR1_040915 [Brachionus plicatilis]